MFTEARTIHAVSQCIVSEIKNQQDTVISSLQPIDRRLHMQEEHMQNLNVSCPHFKNLQDIVITCLQAMDRGLREHDITARNVTQNSWKLAIIGKVNLESSSIGFLSYLVLAFIHHNNIYSFII